MRRPVTVLLTGGSKITALWHRWVDHPEHQERVMGLVEHEGRMFNYPPSCITFLDWKAPKLTAESTRYVFQVKKVMPRPGSRH